MFKLTLAAALVLGAVSVSPAKADGVRFSVHIGNTHDDRYYRYDRYKDYRRDRYYREYSGPVWREGNWYRCIRPNGRYGILRDRHGRIVWAHGRGYHRGVRCR